MSFSAKKVRFPPLQVSCILMCWKVRGIKDLYIIISKLIILFLPRNVLCVKDHLWVVRVTKRLSWVGNNLLEGFFHWSQSQTKVLWFQRQGRKLKHHLKFSWFPAVLHSPIICMGGWGVGILIFLYKHVWKITIFYIPRSIISSVVRDFQGLYDSCTGQWPKCWHLFLSYG